MFKIFIVEDDLKIRTELESLLQRNGYATQCCTAFDQVVEEIIQSLAHLVLLDITLPEFDGYQICRKLRETTSVPIIMVTSRNSDVDELMSMNLGADDFVTKPYNTQILLARIQTLIKRTYQTQERNVLEYKEVILSMSKGFIRYHDESIELTKNEIRILYLMMKKQGEIVTREEIMSDLWVSDEFVDDNTLTVNINRLRKKLEIIGVYDLIMTKRGIGYWI